jgi:hypothetical protein
MEEESSKPGFMMPILWIVLAGAFCTLSCAGVGFAGMGSETAGVNAAWYASFPFCFFASAALGGVIFHFAIPRASPVRIAGPLGCGCLGGILGIGMVVTFFAAIWPSL